MALIHLFRQCDQHCVFCSYPAEAGAGDNGDLKSWVKEIAEMPPGLVQLSGGEPLLAGVGNLVKLIAFCARAERRVELQTNGVKLADLAPGVLERLVKSLNAAGGYFNFNFSADTPELDLRITRTRGAFTARVRAVKKLLALGAKVRLTYVVSSLNYRASARFGAFAVKNFKGLARLQFSFIKGIGRAGGPGFIPEFSAAAPYLLRALDLCGGKGLKCDVDHIPPCFLGPHHAKSVDIEKMRAGVKGPHLVEKEKVPECAGCGFFEICPGPRKDYIAVHGKLTAKKQSDTFYNQLVTPAKAGVQVKLKPGFRLSPDGI